MDNRLACYNKYQLGPAFWEAYRSLWQNSVYPSAFYSPSFLKALIEDFDYDISFYVKTGPDNKFLASLLLKYTKKQYEFISTGHADHNPLITHKNYSSFDDKVEFLSAVLPHLKKPIFLKNVLDWNKDLSVILSSCKESNKNFLAFPAWKCPITNLPENEKPEYFFRKTFKKSRLNTYFNKIKRMEGFSYSIDTQETDDLKEWVDEFCFNHELRWNNTITPSQYCEKKNRENLLNKIKGWHRDEICVRFTIKAEGRRFATVVGLKEGKRLIYSLPAFAPDMGHTHAGSVIVSEIGKWIAANGFHVLDFGNGMEKYKLRYANQILDLHRIYIYDRKLSTFFLKAWLDKLIRKKQIVKMLWEKLILEFYRGKVGMFLQWLKAKIKLQKTACLSESFFYFKRLIQSRKPKTEMYFCAPRLEPNKKLRPRLVFRSLSVYEVLDFLSREVFLTPSDRSKYILDIAQNKRKPLGLFDENELVQISWLKKASGVDIPPFLQDLAEKKEYFIIMDCFTGRNHRKKGYYTEALMRIRALPIEGENTKFLIYTDFWNSPSKRGIFKAGFQKIAIKKTQDRSIEWIQS